MYTINMPKIVVPSPRIRDSAWFFGTQPKLIGNAFLTNEEDMLDSLEREQHDKVPKLLLIAINTLSGD